MPLNDVALVVKRGREDTRGTEYLEATGNAIFVLKKSIWA